MRYLCKFGAEIIHFQMPSAKERFFIDFFGGGKEGLQDICLVMNTVFQEKCAYSPDCQTASTSLRQGLYRDLPGQGIRCRRHR